MDKPRERQYVRTDDNIPVYYERAGRGAGYGPMDDLVEDIDAPDNVRLYELLFEVNQKLNILLKHFSVSSGLNIPEAREVNISGGGMKFNSNEFFRQGEVLALKTFIPGSTRPLKMKAEVIRCDPRQDGGYEVAVMYTEIDEKIRERLIKYIFARQRQTLRTQKPE